MSKPDGSVIDVRVVRRENRMHRGSRERSRAVERGRIRKRSKGDSKICGTQEPHHESNDENSECGDVCHYSNNNKIAFSKIRCTAGAGDLPFLRR